MKKSPIFTIPSSAKARERAEGPFQAALSSLKSKQDNVVNFHTSSPVITPGVFICGKGASSPRDACHCGSLNLAGPDLSGGRPKLGSKRSSSELTHLRPAPAGAGENGRGGGGGENMWESAMINVF